MIASEDWDAAELRATVRYFTASEHSNVVALREAIITLGTLIDLLVPEGRNKSIALTELESVQMRANRGLFSPAEAE